MKQLLIFSTFFWNFSVFGQDYFPVNGMHQTTKTYYAFTNAIIHINGEQTLEKASLLIRDGKIIDVGENIPLPESCITTNLGGKHVYASFIDLNSNYGTPELENKRNNYFSEQHSTSKKGAFGWNESIKPETKTIESFSHNEKIAEELRQCGIGTVLTHQMDGIVRGTSVLTTLSTLSENKSIINGEAADHFSFQKGSSKQSYPSSLMGVIALIRQTYLDAMWYSNTQPKAEYNYSLQRFTELLNKPHFFEVESHHSLLRAQKISDEFGQKYIYVGKGDEYQRLSEIKAINPYIIIPVNFPEPYNINDPYEAMMVDFGDLKHWELAPANAKLLYDSLINFAFTSHGLKKKSQFLPQIRKAVKYGLPKTAALSALTTIPAAWIGADKELGQITKGFWANFIITTGDIFEENSVILQHWIQGNKYLINEEALIDIRGEYNLYIDEIPRQLSIKGTPEKPTGLLIYKMMSDSLNKKGDLVLDSINGRPIKVAKEKKSDVNVIHKDQLITLNFSITDGVYKLSGNVNFDSGSWDGRGTKPTGEWIKWSAIRNKKHENKNDKSNANDTSEIGQILYPLMAYGWDTLPKPKTILIKNASVWTLEKEGTLNNTDVLIEKGKIKFIGNIADVVGNPLIIDGTGMHLTPGIVDEHSHIAIDRGVNEGSHVVTSEVRIGDVITSNDINIYRQLSGGVTCAQLLHGSANAIGGQSAIIKLKWGYSPEEMKIKNADGFIKFALGENVKQSNWGSFYTSRYPQTRMGIEQIYYDAFLLAKAYQKEWDTYKLMSTKKKNNALPPRRDLKLEALVEILNAKRFISCHSYVQSEINMLMHVADSMGFKVNTFTHILEGYKVADKMKAHGVGASTFSDWWAYKYEVNDAIPYNASLLNQMEIVTAVNSDDAEMARRLNQEAAKAIKYGGMSQEDALKLVTLNPAKLLHLDNNIGSIKVGKDADLVLWTDNPLSINAKVQTTIIEGIIFYDAQLDIEKRKLLNLEKSRLINAMIDANQGGGGRRPGRGKNQGAHICSQLNDDGNVK